MLKLRVQFLHPQESTTKLTCGKDQTPLCAFSTVHENISFLSVSLMRTLCFSVVQDDAFWKRHLGKLSFS